VIAQVGSQKYFVSFQHRPNPFGDLRRPPTRRELIDALTGAGTILHGFATVEQFQRSGIDIQSQVREVLARLMARDVKTSHESLCLIKDSNSILVSSGAALCDKRDQFSKPMGRVLGMVKAVMAFPLKDRDKFFDAYARSGASYPHVLDAIAVTADTEEQDLIWRLYDVREQLYEVGVP
jgi:hypothetical protein